MQKNNQVGGVSNTIGLSTVNGALVYLCARTSTWPSAERRAKYFVYVPSPSSLRRAMYLVYLCACRVTTSDFGVLERPLGQDGHSRFVVLSCMTWYSYTKVLFDVLLVWIGNFPNPNFVFPIFPIFPGKYKKQVYKSGYEFVKQNISQVFISERYFPGNMGNINYISREIY